MNNGIILKNYEISKDDIEKINKYTQRKFTEKEIFVFKVALCDNEVDRQGEKFSVSALERLAEMFRGKSGILDHNPTANGQTARIYETWTEQDPKRTTQTGETYVRLMAKAYVPRSEKNREFILDIESGIKKEVSVGCAVSSVTCSICGTERKKGCVHKKGQRYAEKLCCDVLSCPTDAYEWSFVAVPAQREAGVVTKSFYTGIQKERAEEVWKSAVKNEKDVFFSKEEIAYLEEKRKELQQLADIGEFYKNQLTENVIRAAAVRNPDFPKNILEKTLNNLTIEEMQEVLKVFKDNQTIKMASQFKKTQKQAEDKFDNSAFCI